MRRKDREMNKEFAFEIIDKSTYGVLSMVDGDEAYSLPLSVVRDGDYLYFHSALEGRKVEVLAKNPNVSIVFVGEINIPENYELGELEEMNKDPKRAIQFISNVFTTEFESAIISGQVEVIISPSEKIHAMRLICEKYTPSKMKYFDTAIDAGIKRTKVYRVKIENVSSKRKKYDKTGVEMKWARME